MRLNVEISAAAGYWDDDKLRRLMKRAITDAVSDVLNGEAIPSAELSSLRFVKPSTRKKTS